MVAKTAHDFLVNDIWANTDKIERQEPGVSIALMKKMGENGVLYVEKNYRWDVVIEKYKNAIEKVRKINQ